MKYNIDEIQKRFSIQLDDNQLSVLEELIKFYEGDKFDLTLCGKAGCGKTTIIGILTYILRRNHKRYLLIAPTHKAKNILSSKTKDDVSTIHRILNLHPNLDVLDLNLKDLKFLPKKTTSYLEDGSVWIIDECSMINDDLHKLICEKAKKSKCKIIFVGDNGQLQPVKQNSHSKTFNSEIILKLEKIYRNNSESKIGKLLEKLRSSPIHRFTSLKDSDSELVIYNNIKDLLIYVAPFFKASLNLGDRSIIKMFSYTNKRVAAINHVLQKLIFGDNEIFHNRELLTCYDSMNYNGGIRVENSCDYIVKKFSHETKKIRNYEVPFYKVELLDTADNNSPFNISILDPKCNHWIKKWLSLKIEKYRNKAIETKKWNDYFQFIHSFATMEDLCIGDRIIKRKTFDYGYCQTCHRSQSDQYRMVVIDMENLMMCSGEELRQLQYVALSRTEGDIHIYQK